jgi:hypothetical protein
MLRSGWYLLLCLSSWRHWVLLFISALVESEILCVLFSLWQKSQLCHSCILVLTQVPLPYAIDTLSRAGMKLTLLCHAALPDTRVRVLQIWGSLRGLGAQDWVERFQFDYCCWSYISTTGKVWEEVILILLGDPHSISWARTSSLLSNSPAQSLYASALQTMEGKADWISDSGMIG